MQFNQAVSAVQSSRAGMYLPDCRRDWSFAPIINRLTIGPQLLAAVKLSPNDRRSVPQPDVSKCSEQNSYWMVLGASAILGSRIVKVEPRPGSLSTVMSPPIIWQKRLLIARPRPVPPYLLAVADEA